MGRPKPKGSVHAAKPTAQQMMLAKKLKAKQVSEKAQEFRPDDSDDELQMYTDAKDDSGDDENEEEVFDLEGEEEDSDDKEGSDDEDDDDDDKDDDEDDDDSAGDDEDDDDDDEDADDNLKNLVDGLDPRLRQKVMMGGKKSQQAADSDDSEEEEEEPEEGWGKKKAYWSGDTADLEIGQDVQDAEDEEEAAEELQKQKLGRMQESDYFEDFGENHVDDDEVEEVEEKKSKRGKKGKAQKQDKLMGVLEELALGDETEPSSVHVEHITRDISKLTEEQKLKIVKAQSPELLGLISELKDRVAELRDKIAPLRLFVLKTVASSSTREIDDDIVDYLEVKQQLLLSYCINVTFYLYMKAQGQSVRAHPVMKQLLELRYAMEKMRSLDGKLKHQIDRLMKLSTQSADDTAGSSSLRPNPLALLSKDTNGDDDEDDEESGNYNASKSSSTDLYRAPKMAAAPYKESESEASKREDKMKKRKKKLSSSEIMETLREEFSSAPESSSSSGISKVSVDQQRLQEEANERKDFEEERFVRLTMSREEKKAIKRRTTEASRLDNFNDIGDIGEFEEIAELSKGMNKNEKGNVRNPIESEGKKEKKSTSSEDTAKALQRAVSAFQSGSSGLGKRKEEKESDDYLGDLYDAKESRTKKSKPSMDDMGDDSDGDNGDGGDDMDYDDDDYDLGSSKDKRRKAPEGPMDEDDGENLLEEFSKKKKEFANKKKEHYAGEVRYGGAVENVPESGKRAATYEIMKNKGLTPHRKKENRNPRVKKRMAYDKAIVARKGQVREVTAGAAGSYDGELTGIKANISRSRKIGN